LQRYKIIKEPELKKGAVFIDRDGTINEEMGYINHLNRFRLFPWAAEAIKALNKKCIPAVVLTNQSGVARGYFSSVMLDRVHDFMINELAKDGARLDGIYVCQHGPDDGCTCRKPFTGLADQAAVDLNIDLNSSYVIGDRFKDILLAKRIGSKGIMVMTGYGKGEWEYIQSSERIEPDYVADDLKQAVDWIICDLAER